MNIKRTLFIFSLAGVSVSLPLSEWLLSVFLILSVVIWIVAGGPAKALKNIKSDRELLVFTIIYMVYLLWMAGTSDLDTGLLQLRLKLPVVLLPFVIFTFVPYDPKEIRLLIFIFIAGVVVSSGWGFLSAIMSGTDYKENTRILSPFISHIRLALMAVFAILSSGWYLAEEGIKTLLKILLAAALMWLTIFIFLLLSFTGIVMLAITILVTVLIFSIRTQSLAIRILMPVAAFGILLSAGIIIVGSVKSFYRNADTNTAPLALKTASGNYYSHDTLRKDIENGNRVWVYICEKELRKEWDRRSRIRYDSTDLKGQELRFTLMRYLASAGLKKDSAGLSLLSQQDILNVESGMTNKLFQDWSPLKIKLYETIWQVDYYLKGGNPSGHSITQRIEYFKTGTEIFRKYPWFGTGTGDLPAEYSKQYLLSGSVLDEKHRLLSHNQFLNFLVTFGITGSLLIMFAILRPFIIMKRYREFLPSIFLLIIFLSMLWEDTLETHTGVTFFAYFYALLIFGKTKNENNDL